MLTQCPNPSCKLTFEVQEARSGKNGPCPACGQVITFRSLDILLQLERQRRKINQAEGLSGMPGVQKTPLVQARPAEAQVPTQGFCTLLEDIRSLWNVGSIFRTADGAGFAPIYLCGITGCPPRKEIAKTSLGAEEHLPWEYYPSALEILPGLKAAGVQIVGLESTEQSIPLAQALTQGSLQPPLCLVVGNEVSGISAETLAACDRVCHLPMRGVKTSLNVAVAFGIAAYMLANVKSRESPP